MNLSNFQFSVNVCIFSRKSLFCHNIHWNKLILSIFALVPLNFYQTEAVIKPRMIRSQSLIPDSSNMISPKITPGPGICIVNSELLETPEIHHLPPSYQEKMFGSNDCNMKAVISLSV